MDLSKLHLNWQASSYKGKVYRSYSLALSIRKNGRNGKEIVVKLGKLTDEQANQWRNLLKALKRPDAFVTTLDDLVVTEHFAYLDVAVANATWDSWELDNAFSDRGSKKLSCATIARILAINRCIDPAVKSKTPEWFQSTALPWILDVDPEVVNTSRIFRELDVIEDHKEAICKHIYAQLLKHNPNSLNSLFYDLSSTSFHGSRCVLMKWGHCKEGFRNHVVLALVVNNDGIPFYWEVLPGGTADATTIIWLLERLRERFKVSGTTLVFDRGMVSDDNLCLLEKAEIKYISAMDRSQLEGVTGIDFRKFSHLKVDRVEKQSNELAEFTKLNNNTYYREVKVEGERRYIICFNPQLFKDQRKARKTAVEDFQVFVDDLNRELYEAKNSRQRKATYKKFKERIIKSKLKDFVDVDLQIVHVKRKAAGGTDRDVRTYQGTIVIDEKKMLDSGRLDGFWLLVTNHNEKEGEKFTVSAEDAISPYRDKVLIELAFRDIKSFIEVDPVHVWTEAHVKAHYTCCVLSYLGDRTLTLRLHENVGKLTKGIVWHETLYKTLSGCMLDRIEVANIPLSTINSTKVTDEQKELLQRVGLERLLSCEIVKKARSSMQN